MARTVNHANRTIRRDAFVDTAQRLIVSKGYEQMSVQDVLDALDASRGAFYHYFDSKVALLEAVIERMVVEATARVERMLADPDVTALAKLSQLLTDIADYKNERQDLVRGFLQVWLSDDNVLVRDKLRRLTVARLTPQLVADEHVVIRKPHLQKPADQILPLVLVIGDVSEQSAELGQRRASGSASIRSTLAVASTTMRSMTASSKATFESK